MAPSFSKILFYTTVAVAAYFIMYALLVESFSADLSGTHDPDLQLVKQISGFTGLVVTLIVYGIIKWTRKTVKKGSEWAKDMGDKGREKLESMRSQSAIRARFNLL